MNGAKAVAEIPIDGMAPAIASAIFDATGVPARDSVYVGAGVVGVERVSG